MPAGFFILDWSQLEIHRSLGIPYYLAREDTTDPATQATYTAAIERALELGINYFDTAPGYGNGTSETILGNALSTYRDQIFLASKVTYSGTPNVIQESIEQSLRRLKTDYLDVLQFHGGYFNDREADEILNGGRLEWLEQPRDAGKIRFIGITAEVPTGALERLLTTNRFDVLQICSEASPTPKAYGSLCSPTTSSYGSLRSPTASPYGYNLINQLACSLRSVVYFVNH